MGNKVEKLIRTYPKAKISVFAKNKTTDKVISYKENIQFGVASIIKVAIALVLLKKADDKSVKLDDPILLKMKANLGKYSNGIFSYLPKGTIVSLRMACILMLKMSDNMATNFVLEYVTQDEVNEYMKSLGLQHTKLTTARIKPEQLEREKNLLGTTTAEDIATLFEKIALGDLPLSKTNILALQNMLEIDYPGKTFDRILPSIWNVGPKKTKIKTTYAKDGSFPLFELRCDAFSIITKKDELISGAILTQGIKSNTKDGYPSNLNTDHPANLFIAEVAKELLNNLY